MPESNKPFVVTDRRKFTKEGELRPGAEHAEPRPEPTPAPRPEPVQAAPSPVLARAPEPTSEPSQLDSPDQPPTPTTEQLQQVRFAYEQTAERIDTAMRAADPGGDHLPPMNFDGLVQSLYLTAIMQLGGGTQEGEKPRIDIMGARQTIDMLAVVGDRTSGNLNPQEIKLLETALFELRMAFLEVTDALARSAAKAGAPGRPPGPPKPGLVY